MKTQTKTVVPFQLKAADDNRRTFRGLAAAWSLDQGDDVIHKGAFARTIDHWRSSKRVIPLLDQHRSYGSITAVLGKMTDAAETEEGLECEFEFVPDDEHADAAYKRVKGGYVTSLSIGYQPVRYAYRQKEGGASWERIRDLFELKLLENSLVIFPMNEDAQVDLASVKSLADLEAALRTGQLSPDQKAHLRALLDAPPADGATAPAAPAPKGLAPDDPARLRLEELLRDVTLRSLGTRAA